MTANTDREDARETSGKFGNQQHSAPEVSFKETAEEQTSHRFVLTESTRDDGMDEDMYSARCRDCDYVSEWEDSVSEAASWGTNHHDLMIFGMDPATGETKTAHGPTSEATSSPFPEPYSADDPFKTRPGEPTTNYDLNVFDQGLWETADLPDEEQTHQWMLYPYEMSRGDNGYLQNMREATELNFQISSADADILLLNEDFDDDFWTTTDGFQKHNPTLPPAVQTWFDNLPEYRLGKH
jgi:hypothetical protein